MQLQTDIRTWQPPQPPASAASASDWERFGSFDVGQIVQSANSIQF
jgi:hypothetical protein